MTFNRCDIDGSDERHDGSERYWHCEERAIVRCTLCRLGLCSGHAADHSDECPGQLVALDDRLITKSGKVLTDKDIEELAAEAERGYDVEALRQRPSRRGRTDD